MSPRAAWRLESLGFAHVYDFVPGKAAWMAMGLPREGHLAAIPNAGEVADPAVATCLLSDPIGEVRRRTGDQDLCIVLHPEGAVMGRLRAEALAGEPHARAQEVMEPGVTTIRPSEPLGPLVERMRKRGVTAVLVTTLKGKLVGLLRRERAEGTLASSASSRANRA